MWSIEFENFDSIIFPSGSNQILKGWIQNNGNIKKPVISYRGIPEKNEDDTFIFDMEDEIMNICRTFSMDNKKQQQNLIETLKQNCRRIVREKTGKKPFTNINITRI